MPDIFNLMQSTMQHLYNIYTAYVPVLMMIYPHDKVLQTLNSYPVIFSVILPVLLFACFLLLTLPLCLLVIQFIKLGKSEDQIQEDNLNIMVKDSLNFKDFCECSESRIVRPRFLEKQEKNTKEEKFYLFLNLSLGIFAFLMVIIYPFSIKITKSLIETEFRAAISNQNADRSSWLIVLDKYISIFFFDDKFGQVSSCSLSSNPFITGFWHNEGVESIPPHLYYGDKFLEVLYSTQEEKMGLFSAKLATSSLTISFATLFHFITIYVMLQGNIFNQISDNWRTGVLKIRIGILILIIISLGINISRYFICLDNSNVWISFLQRLGMVLICTPSSVVLEWICLKVYYSYITSFQNCILMLLSSGTSGMPDKEKLLSDYLQRGYLNVRELRQWKASVSKYTKIICSLLEEKTNHKFQAIDTGSIVERFGFPLAASREGLNYLKTDHDVMFIPTSLVVSLERGRLTLVGIDGHEEYFHMLATTKNCKCLNYLSDNEGFIDNRKDKMMMKTIVASAPKEDFVSLNINAKNLLGLACINFTQRLLKWDRIQTTVTGPALNFKVITAHLNHSLAKQNEWVKRVDCDFILAFHLDHWPVVAGEWATRPRQWPTQKIVKRIVKAGCELVPKIRSTQDNRAWRLSFSMAEYALSCCVGEKARKTYLAVKLLVKEKLKPVCPFLKTYHIKTIFFHFMESKTEEYWENTELNIAIGDLLGKSMSYLIRKKCYFYFSFVA